MDSREDYSYGWNAQGNRFYALKSGILQGRVNMIAAYGEGELLAPFTVEGSCNRTVFETWLETCLIPTLKQGQIVIADNATFHKGGRIFQLIEAAGCQLKYLPPYSPDLNKIERCWSWLKSRIRKQLIQFDCRAGCHGSCASHSGLTAGRGCYTSAIKCSETFLQLLSIGLRCERRKTHAGVLPHHDAFVCCDRPLKRV